MSGSGRRTINALFIQHQADVPPGLIGERAEQRGIEVDVLRAAPGAYPDDPRRYDLIVPLGSGEAAYDDDVPWIQDERAFLRAAIHAGVPVFGICFGAQILAHVLGGQVRPGEQPEIGWMPLRTIDPQRLDPGPWLVWHFDVLSPPPEAVELANTAVGTQAFEIGSHLGVQFHPEATPDSVASWADTYADAVERLGLTPDRIVEQTRLVLDDARARAYTLFDRFLDRSVLPRLSTAASGSTPREG